MAYRPLEPLGKHHVVEEFACGEAALDDWLKRHALPAQASDTARVYVATLDDNETVIAYFAINTTQIAPDDATERAMKGQPSGRPVPAILLSRFAVDENHQGQGLGRSLLMEVLVRCASAAEIVGVKALLVHAKPNAAAFYTQYGFEESPTDPLHLLLLMKDLRAFLRAEGLG